MSVMCSARVRPEAVRAAWCKPAKGRSQSSPGGGGEGAPAAGARPWWPCDKRKQQPFGERGRRLRGDQAGRRANYPWPCD